MSEILLINVLHQKISPRVCYSVTQARRLCWKNAKMQLVFIRQRERMAMDTKLSLYQQELIETRGRFKRGLYGAMEIFVQIMICT